MSAARGLRHRMRVAFREFEDRVSVRGTHGARLVLYLWRLGAQVLRQWARDRCPQQAASLAFQTVLSLVPVLAVALAAIRATGALNAESTLVDFLSSKLIPVSPEEMAARLQGWASNVSIESLGIVGLVSTVLLAFVMFNNVERTMNQIWRVERRRPVTQKFVVFYATATIGPILFGTSLYHAAHFGLTEGGLGALLSVGITFIALLLANVFLPATRVDLGPAAIGAAFTTVASELAKLGFTTYVSQYAFARYAGVYGAVAALPLLLIWIYWSWLMLLLGVEIAHASQNIRWLEGRDRRRTLSLENELLQRVTGPMAARIMTHVAQAYGRGDKVVSRQALADRFDLSSDALERLTSRLCDRDLLLEVEGEHTGFMPARPLSTITLAEILSAFRAEDRFGTAARRDETAVETLLMELDQATEARTRSVTLAELAGDPPP